jgi:hypothetical protein
LQSDSNKFARRVDRNRKMATEGHGCDGNKDHQKWRKDEMDKEIAEVRVRMEKLGFQM